MIKITVLDLKDGDQLLQRNNFNRKDINTWMSPIVYYGINFWPKRNHTAITEANHCGTLYFINGEWYICEAKRHVVFTKLSDKMANKDITSIYVKRYENIDSDKMLLAAYSRLGCSYDYWSILKQVGRQLSNEKIDLETNPSKFKNKKVNCSELNGEQAKAGGIWFNNTKSLSPANINLDQRSNYIGHLKFIS